MQDLPLNLTTLNPHGVPGLPEMRKVMIEDLLTPCLVFPLYPKKNQLCTRKGSNTWTWHCCLLFEATGRGGSNPHFLPLFSRQKKGKKRFMWIMSLLMCVPHPFSETRIEIPFVDRCWYTVGYKEMGMVDVK